MAARAVGTLIPADDAEDPDVRGARTVLVLGWLTSLWRRSGVLGEEIDAKKVAAIVRRELGQMLLTGEADWAYVVSIALFVERDGTTTAAQRQLKVLALLHGKLPPHRGH